MIVGSTGSGKSSTINALFGREVSTVGVGVEPETVCILKYELENLILWDTPGLGDGKESDKRYSIDIINELKEVYINGNLLIDLVVIILDASSKDLGTSYNLINNIIIPNIGNDKERRIVIALNQSGLAMKGKYWNYEKNEPEKQLKEFLENKVISVKNRIKESTNLYIMPIYYSAGFKENEKNQSLPYNLSKLLYHIIKLTPTEKRLAYIENINNDFNVWQKNDCDRDYNIEIKKNFIESIRDYIDYGITIGDEFGCVFGKTGQAIGRTLVGF